MDKWEQFEENLKVELETLLTDMGLNVDRDKTERLMWIMNKNRLVQDEYMDVMKERMEKSLTPKLKSMLSDKLKDKM